MKRYMVLFLVVTASLFLHGCGGGGGGEPTEDNDSNNGSVGDQNKKINGDLVGRIYYDGPAESYVLDLATGERMRFPFDDIGAVWPVLGGTEIVHIDRGEQKVGINRLVIRDDEGRTKASFKVSETLRGIAKLSPDRQTIAVFWSDEANGERFTDPTLTLFSREGQVFTRIPQASSFDWLPDGRLAYTKGEAIYVSDNALTQGVAVKFFDGEAPYDLAISPDGMQMAFTIAGDEQVFKGNVWVMNFDGSGLRQLTTSSMNEVDPVWSPDGKWILVRQGVGSVSGTSGCPGLYAVPSNATLAELTEVRNTPAKKIFYFKSLDSSKEHAVCPFSTVAWSKPVEYLESPGSLPTEVGSPNNGLTGTMYYRTGSSEDMKTWELDVYSAVRIQLREIDGTYVSSDGQEFAAIPFVKTDFEQGLETVIFYQRNSGTVSRFTKSRNISGPVRFSHDDNLVAFSWDTSSSFRENVVVARKDGEVLAQFPGYTTYDWLPDGGLVLADTDSIYRTDAGFGTPIKLFSLTDPVTGLAVSPDGQRMVFSMVGRLWTATLEGQGQDLVRLTQSDGSEMVPEWSPDGRYIAFDHVVDNSSPRYLWVVAADARSVQVGNPGRQHNAVAIREYENHLSRVWTRSYLSWR